jgi:hypothetical protein
MICQHKLDHTEPRHLCDGCCDTKSIIYQINHQFDGIRPKSDPKPKKKKIRYKEDD